MRRNMTAKSHGAVLSASQLKLFISRNLSSRENDEFVGVILFNILSD